MKPNVQNPMDDKIVAYAQRNMWKSLFWWLPRPRLALGADSLYQILVHGFGVEVSSPGNLFVIRGFFASRIVAAASTREAQARAFSAVLDEWREQGRSTQPQLEVERLIELKRRFVLRAPRGFVFYQDP